MASQPPFQPPRPESRRTSLPLERKICRTHDKNTLCKSSQLKLPGKKPCHDSFPCSGIISKEELHPGKLKKIIVHCLKLMRQRVNARYGEAKIRVKFIGYT
jgi:hypothetical protein